MKALVTGGTGFVGSPVVDRLLADGHAVRLLSRRAVTPGRYQGKSVDVVRGDLRDFSSVVSAMNGADLFFHAGEIRNVTQAASEENVRLVENITRHLASQKIQRFVFVSSLTVAGIPSALPANEETTPDVVLHDHYTEYKRRAEEIVREMSGASEFAVIRPAPVYGPGSRYLGKLVKAIEMFGPVGIPFIGSAANIAPLVHVQDLARAIVRAGTKPEAAGQVFNITDGMGHTWGDLFRAVAEAAGRSVRIFPVPALLLKFSTLPFDLLSGFFGMRLDPAAYVEYFSRDLLFDTSRARALLGWSPGYSLSDGIKEMVDFYHGKLQDNSE